MNTKITFYFVAFTLILSSCAKESYYFTNTGSTYGNTKKEQPTAITTSAISTESRENQPAETTPPLTSYASTGKVAIPKKVLTQTKALYQKPVNASVKEQEVFKVAQAQAAIKLTRQIKAKTKKGLPAEAASGKSQLAAAILAFFLGALGVHRFYLGYTGKGLLQLGGYSMGVVLVFGAAISTLFTGAVSVALVIGTSILLAVFIWALIDFIRILIGKLKPKDGEYTSTL